MEDKVEISRYRDFVPAGEKATMPLQRVQMGKDAKGRAIVVSTCQDFIPGAEQIAEQAAVEAAKKPAMLTEPGKKPQKMSNADRRALTMGPRFVQQYARMPKNARLGVVKALKVNQALAMVLCVEKAPDIRKLIESRMQA